jgi:hypothetical protein
MPDAAQQHLKQLQISLAKSFDGASASEVLSAQSIEAYNSAQMFSEWLGNKNASLQRLALQVLSDALRPDAARLAPETIVLLVELLSRNITEDGFTFKAFVIACLALLSRSTAQGSFYCLCITKARASLFCGCPHQSTLAAYSTKSRRNRQRMHTKMR